jgi:acyl-CoA reductase-like NAD-dependent aldehyde dehydrogenase
MNRGSATFTDVDVAADVDADPGTPQELDAAVQRVVDSAAAWAARGPGERAALLDEVLRDTVAASARWLADACAAKGLQSESTEAGEELFAGLTMFVRMARLTRDSLRDLAAGRRPQYPGPVSTSPEGRLRVGVFPVSRADRLIFAGTTGEVWLAPGTTRAELADSQASAYPQTPPATPPHPARVCLVLGAGNVASLGPRDVLAKLFGEGKVVVLKANPVNEYLVPHWERALGALIRVGALSIVRGGAAEGAVLTHDPRIDEIHITGSDKTHDAIVFGTGEEGARRKAAGEPALAKPVSCELGNVSPIIIVPGRWSRADLLRQAEHVATMLVNNAGFNCLTARVIVTHAGWRQREAFLGALAQVLTTLPARRAYYPGAAARRAAVLDAHPDALVCEAGVGDATGDTLPWTLVRGVDPGHLDDICFNVEAFCGLMAETALPADGAAAFIDAATDFCNEVVWGTLSATLLVDPDTEKAPEVAAALQRALTHLRYGAIGINIWHATAFALGTTTWGAFPGHPVEDIRSGSGVVGNAFLLEHTEKSVVRGPFRPLPKPPWYATHRRGYPVMRRLFEYEAAPSTGKLARLLAAAARPA